ncbi:MAG TPA: 4Fe-4S binding protein [Anaerolineales bacterium]|nr:4Fe-4S binding protein [Anaerolineales bacterium]
MGFSRRVFDFLLKLWPVTYLGYWVGRQPGLGRLARPFFSTRLNQATILPVNEAVPIPTQLSLPYSLLKSLIERSDFRFILSVCMCRAQEGCEQYPHQYGCIFLGEAARRIHPSMGRAVDVEQALAYVQHTIELGLVPMVAHSIYDSVLLNVPFKQMLAVCFCCDCCCVVRRGLRTGPPSFGEIVQRLPGLSVSAGEACLLCGACQAVCPVQAITMGEQRAEVGVNCKGCGACVAACPNGAMQFTQAEYSKIHAALMDRVEGHSYLPMYDRRNLPV